MTEPKKTDNMVLDESYQILTGNIPQQAKIPSRGMKWNSTTKKVEPDYILPPTSTSLVIPKVEELKEKEVKGGETLLKI